MIFIYFLFEWQLTKYLPKGWPVFEDWLPLDRQLPLGVFDVIRTRNQEQNGMGEIAPASWGWPAASL